MDTDKKWYEDFEVRHDLNADHTQTVTIYLPYAGQGFSFSGTALTGTTKSIIELLESALTEISKRDREERRYSSKEIHQFVAEYAKEANDEGFDMLVGDFADWIEFRGSKREEKVECKHGNKRSSDYGETASEYCVDCGEPIAEKRATPAKPVLPENLEDPCYVQYGTESEREMLLLIVKLIRKQNEILDYLSRKEQ